MEAEPVLMPLRRPGVLAAAPAWGCRLLAALLILGAAAAHLAYLVRDCPLDLAPDEAHYWDWSRHLDWSYYSKGPLVAWLIRAACELFGPLSVRLTGTLMPAVRLPAVLCSTLLLVSLYALTVQTFRNERLALGLVAAALTLPVLSVGASIMTIDAPYTCCWGWALVFGHRAVFRGGRGAWLALGLANGLGILAKYTMVLFLPSLALFLLTTPAYRGLLLGRGFRAACAAAALCCLPIVLWNARHRWVTLYHLLGLSGFPDAGVKDGAFHWTGPFVLFGAQAALLLVFWFVCWLCAMIAHPPGRESDPDVRYLWWLSAPMFGVFLGFSVKTGGGEVNWPVTTYLSGLVLAAPWLVRRLESPRTWSRRLTYVHLTLACSTGLAITLFMHRTDWLYRPLAKLAGPPTDASPFPLRKLDPSCRLRGYRELAAEVDGLRDRLRAEDGIEPVLAACGWNLPGELGFYCAGHPQAYSLGLALGDRHSQYDLWPNPLDDPDAFRGRTFLLVGTGHNARLNAGFEQVREAGRVVHSVKGYPVAEWTVLVGRGYKGFPTLPPTLRH